MLDHFMLLIPCNPVPPTSFLSDQLTKLIPPLDLVRLARNLAGLKIRLQLTPLVE